VSLRSEFADSFDDALLVVRGQRAVHRKPHKAIAGVFGDWALSDSTTKSLTNRRGVQRLIMENARYITCLHVVDKAGSLLARLEAHVVDVADVLTAFGNHWQLDAVMMSPCSEL